MPNQPLKSARRPVIYTGSGSAIDNYNSGKPVTNENWGVFKKDNQQHRQILSLVRQLQWTVKSDRWGEVADMSGAFTRWLQSEKSPVKKPLQSMTQAEVSKVISALEGVVEWKFNRK